MSAVLPATDDVPVLKAQGVSLSIGQSRVLREVDLEVPPHEFLAILALGGAGKTQLFRLLAGLQPPTGGRISWFGEPLDQLGERQVMSLRRLVGAVHQHGALFADLTVEENILLPLIELTDHDQTHIHATLEFTLAAAGLAEHRQQYPSALAAVTLRKVALARALVMGPRLLICDDVFAGLDPRARVQVSDYLKALHMLRDMTTIILTHNAQMALQMADRVIVLAQGRFVAAGPPQEILCCEHPEVISLLQGDSSAMNPNHP